MTSTTDFNQPQNKINQQNPLPNGLRARSKLHKPGFTIIEVVLVLAIAGLIFLMVFIALPALQRNQRDTQRKNDMSRLLSAANSYAANNRGSYALWTTTATRDAFVDNYLKIDGDDFSDPDGRPYLLTASTTEQVNHKVIIVNLGGYQCGDNESMVYTGNINEIAFRVRLEGGGIYCVDN